MRKRYSVPRTGMGGRPAGEQPQTLIRIAATPDEIIIIQSLTPRERAEAMIKAAQEKTQMNNRTFNPNDDDSPYTPSPLAQIPPAQPLPTLDELIQQYGNDFITDHDGRVRFKDAPDQYGNGPYEYR